MRKKSRSPQKSIKKNLIIQLSSLVALALAITYCVSFFYAKKDVSAIFDAELVKSSKLIFNLVEHEHFRKDGEEIDEYLQEKILNRYEYKFHSQAWKSDKIIYNSGEHIRLQMPENEGFSDFTINNEKWRGFAFFDTNSQIKILVLEKYEIRKELASEILISLLTPLLAAFFLMFFIIKRTVDHGLQPLEILARDIAKISQKTLKHFKNPGAPKELNPFLEAFDSLLSRLHDSIEAEQRFTNYAAHELNTPLATIKLRAELLVKNHQQEKREEYANHLLESINRATHIVEQLLTLSRLEANDRNFKKEKINLQKLLTENVKIYQEKALTKKILIRFQAAASKTFELHANQLYLEILFGNLLDNAIKYSPQNSEISITLTKNENRIELTISNPGEDFSAEEISKIFNNFYRINKGENLHQNLGCGLGLSIAKKIVKLHEGLISFASQGKQNSVKVIFKP